MNWDTNWTPRYRRFDDAPPNFETKNDDEKRWMYEWVYSRLKDRGEPNEGGWLGTDLEGLLEEQYEEEVLVWFHEDLAIEAARRYGDLEPLKARFPKIAEFVNLPTGGPRGSTWRNRKRLRSPYPPRDRRDRIELASAEVAAVRRIWKRRYKQTTQRGHDGQLSAYEIVAKRWKVKVDEILHRQRHPRLKRPSPLARTDWGAPLWFWAW